MGQKMTLQEQKKALDKGFLIIEIGLPAQTSIPASFEDFESLREQSNFSIASRPTKIQKENQQRQKKHVTSQLVMSVFMKIVLQNKTGCHFNECTISRKQESIDLSDDFVNICLFHTCNVINSFCSVKKVETYNVFTKAYDKEDQSDMQDFTEETFECTIGDCSPELYEKN
mmetsp:Transcript_27703/g.31761  ORF Transcript_27703/g.31761 Transcript_27703/m.31761 type:complete len:171 (+) Transcript_27703:322-834(+)